MVGIIKYRIRKCINALRIYMKYKKYHKNIKREFILFGTPIHGNIGDHAITVSEYSLLSDCNIDNIFEISSFERFYLIDYIAKNIKNNAVIMINGGGFMGSQWINEEYMIRDVVKHFPNNKIIIFPQTAFYKDDEQGKETFKESFSIYNSHKDLVFCAREEKTYNFFLKKYKNAKVLLLPDIVLYLDKNNTTNERNNALLCLRHDPEKNVSKDTIDEVINIIQNKYEKIDSTDTVIKEDILPNNRKTAVYNKMKEFSNYEVVVTDRLHGMIFAFLTNTPCIVFGNYNHKVEGVYQWIKQSEKILFIKNEDDINKIKSFINNDNKCDYNVDKTLFNELKNIIMEEK